MFYNDLLVILIRFDTIDSNAFMLFNERANNVNWCHKVNLYQKFRKNVARCMGKFIDGRIF